MKIIGIYDNGGKTVDRYTIVLDEMSTPQFNDMLGIGDSPSIYSQFTSGQFDTKNPSGNRHLGKRVRFEELTEELQKHIAERIFN